MQVPSFGGRKSKSGETTVPPNVKSETHSRGGGGVGWGGSAKSELHVG